MKKRYKPNQSLYHVNHNQPDKLLETLNITLTADQQTYLLAHKSEPRTKLAKKLGITKLQLCQYLCNLYPMVAEETQEKISRSMKDNKNAKKKAKLITEGKRLA